MNEISFKKQGAVYAAVTDGKGQMYIQIKGKKAGSLTISQYIDGMEPVVMEVNKFQNSIFGIYVPEGLKILLESDVEVEACKYVAVSSSNAAGGSFELKKASDSELGGVMTGFSQSGKNYPLSVDGSGKAYVNVPWTDTTYVAAKTSALGLVKQAAAVTDATGEPDAHTQLNALLASLRTAGVLATA